MEFLIHFASCACLKPPKNYCMSTQDTLLENLKSYVHYYISWIHLSHHFIPSLASTPTISKYCPGGHTLGFEDASWWRWTSFSLIHTHIRAYRLERFSGPLLSSPSRSLQRLQHHIDPSQYKTSSITVASACHVTGSWDWLGCCTQWQPWFILRVSSIGLWNSGRICSRLGSLICAFISTWTWLCTRFRCCYGWWLLALPLSCTWSGWLVDCHPRSYRQTRIELGGNFCGQRIHTFN